MESHLTLLEVSAFSGLAGAILTQLISAANTYFIESRKKREELRTQFRNKRIEIGENYYYINGEIMAVIKKNIEFWKNFNDSRSEASLESLNKEVKAFTSYLEKLNAENWKYNLISLYFKVSFTTNEILHTNAISRKHHLKILDLNSSIRRSNEGEKEELIGKYAMTVFDMCNHYQDVYDKMEHDRMMVRKAMLEDYVL